MSVELLLSIVATTLSVAAFCGEGWRIWRDRPRLIFFVRPITFRKVPHFGDMKMLQVMICNVGYRPIVLTKFLGLGERSSFQMGIDDEPAAALGQQDQRFPTLLEPGETLKIHPMEIGALIRNQTDPQDPKVHHDPYRYFVVIDSFQRAHAINIVDVLGGLHISSGSPSKRHGRLREAIRQKLFLRRMKAWMRN